MEMTKGQFASHIGVSAGRVSQYIASGIIGPDALRGEGRTARVVVEKATAQIAARRHVGQALGNGLMTRVAGGEQAAPPSPGDGLLPLRDPDTAELIQLERLTQERRKNRLAEIDEAQRLGSLVPVDEMRREIGKAAQTLVNTFTGMAPDIANAIAARFEVPARDVLHLVRQVMTEKRAEAATAEHGRAAAMPETVEAATK